MLLKALTFHKKGLEDNFEPYIHDIVKDTMRISKSLLEEISPESTEVKFVTYANLLSVLCFDAHPNTRHEIPMKQLLKLDQSVYQLLLENLFVQLS